jgi:hypothetical protein
MNEYDLPSNENAAKRRTDSTIRRISKDQETFNKYYSRSGKQVS